MSNIRRSEVLCYVQNNFKKFARENLATCLNGFYTNDEILEAKNDLFVIADEVKTAELSLARNKSRRGEAAVRRQADVSDLLTLWEELDAAKLSLPLFVAADLSRIPPLVMADSDLCTMNVSIFEVKNMLSSVIATQTQMAAQIQVLEAAQSVQTSKGSVTQSRRPAHLSGQLQTSTNATVLPSPLEVTGTDESSGSGSDHTWAGLAAMPAQLQQQENNAIIDDQEFTLVSRNRYRKPVQIKHGTKKIEPSVVSGAKQLSCVPRIKRVVAYVGRLHKDTTEDELMDFLSNVKLANLRCRKLVSKDGKVYKTAAFMVSCDESTREAFHNEANWPEGCELRDWYFKSH